MTWGDILTKLKTFSPEQLAQPAHILPHNDKDETGLYQIYELHSIDYWSRAVENDEVILRFRSANDNQFHPEHFAFLMDGPPASKDGDTLYTLLDDGRFQGNVSGKIIDWSEDD